MIERLLAGEAALSNGELDAAERLFTQVADADPRNAIAVAGRARVAFARGATDDARAFAQDALTIDPDEVAAQWLIRELAMAQASSAPTPVSPPQSPSAPSPGSATTARRTGFRGWLTRLFRRR